MLTRFKILPLPLLKKTGERFIQCIDIEFELTSVLPDKKAMLKVIRGNERKEFDLGIPERSKSKKEIYLPEAETETETEFTLFYGDSILTQKLSIGPVKRWEIFLVLHSHTDLGFTAPISDVAKIHNDNTDVAVLYCKETENWPSGSQFKWTCEVSWQLQNYIRDRNHSKVNELFEQVRKKNIEIAGLYSGELTELLGHEEASRSFYYAAKLRRKYGVNIDTAMLCDVPGCTKGFVQIMAKSGIKNFIVADNNFIAPFLTRTDLPRPFYWRGDDNTKVLSWYTDHPFYAYIEGQNYGLSYSCSETRDKLPYKLLELEKSGYMFNEFQFQYAFDNFRIEFRPAAIVKEWNEKWAYPKIKISTAGEFLNTVRNKHNDKIPVKSGDWTNWWDGIVTGFPNEASLARKMHEMVPAIETMAACLKYSVGSEYPAEKITEMYDNLLAFDEHSGTGMVWEAKSEEQQQQALREGYGLIQKPYEKSMALHRALQYELTRSINVDSEAILVFNSKSANSGWVEVSIDKADGLINLIDKTNCRTIWGSIRNNKLKFYAEDIPSIGYKIYKINTDDTGDALIEPGSNMTSNDSTYSIENKYWSLQLDKRSGRIISLINKHLDEEVVSGEFNSPVMYQSMPAVQVEMGKYIPEIYNGDEVPGEIVQIKEPDESKINMFINNAGFTECVIENYYQSNKWMSQRIFLENDLVIFENTLESSFIYNKELMEKFLATQGMLYFLFAFNIPHARFRYEAPCAVLDPKAEQFKGSCMDYYAVQRWSQLYNDSVVINFCSIDSPLIDVGEIALHKYRKNFTDDPSVFYVRAASLSNFHDELRSPYINKPDLHFRFGLSMSKTGEYLVKDEQLPSLLPAYTTANKLNSTLQGFYLHTGGANLLNSSAFSFVEISPANFELLTIKKAEDNNDLILRIREILGIRNSVAITINIGIVSKAFKTMITEEIIEEIPVYDNTIKINSTPFSVETIRVVLKNETN